VSFVILEGLDRSGKTSVANIYKKQGFDIVHMEAPDKKYTQPGYSGPSYLEEIVDMYNIYAGKDVVFDRSPYGECVWPEVYNRMPCLTLEDLEYLSRLEYNNNTTKILMYDEDVEAHWNRCVANNEPINRLQFVQAGRLYDELATKHNFEKRQLKDFSVKEHEEVKNEDGKDKISKSFNGNTDSTRTLRQSNNETYTNVQSTDSKEALESKLERANAIRGLLKAPLVKKKGEAFQRLEKDIKVFLEQELENIFKEERKEEFTQDEVQILKIYASRIKEKLG